MQCSSLRFRTLVSSVLLMAAGVVPILADEGMWTFDNPPIKQLKERHNFSPDSPWLEHVRLSSVRFNDGGSGSFVSPDGLVLTNHHVALGQLQKVSTPEHNYVRNGFLASGREAELKCPDLELNVLVSMEDVTARVMAAARSGKTPAAALEARKTEIARIEKESTEKTGLRSDVVVLYQGGEYWLYRYKKFTDIRLAFAPEQQAAFYGGDPDNFTFPRYDLDMALFRVYENGQPLHSAHFLKWNPSGASEGDLVFVSGHPGSTNRLHTVAQLKSLRDQGYPTRLAMLRKNLEILRNYSQRGPEEARQALASIFGIENSLKASEGEWEGLKNPTLMAKKEAEEKEFRRLVDSRPEWKAEYAGAWDAIATAEKKAQSRQKEKNFRRMPGQRLGNLAVQIVSYVEETARPDSEREDGYHEAQLESLRFRMLSPAPVYPGIEELQATAVLRQALEELGGEDPFVKAALNGQSPEEAARALVSGTRLADPAFRKELLKGGKAAVEASTDPFIVLARKVRPLQKELRKWYEDEVESQVRPAQEKIGAARFAVYGKNAYPDATFTLRLSYGTVKGYPMNGSLAPYKTTFYGLYDRSASFDNKPPFQLPERWMEGRSRLDLQVPFNFVCSCDIIGGNSGSPVVNRNGELVGLVFDGNIESLVGRFVFDETANRTVAVHSAGMTEAMTKLYGAGNLVKEILGQ